MYTYLYPPKIVINLVQRYDQPNILWRRLFRRQTMSYQIMCSFERKRSYDLCRIRHWKFTSIPIIRLIAHLGERWTYDANDSETPAWVAYALAISPDCDGLRLKTAHWRPLEVQVRVCRLADWSYRTGSIHPIYCILFETIKVNSNPRKPCWSKYCFHYFIFR